MCERERFEDRRHLAWTTFILSSRTGNDRESYKGTSSPRGRKIYRQPSVLIAAPEAQDRPRRRFYSRRSDALNLKRR